MSSDTWFKERSARIVEALFDRMLRVFAMLAALAATFSVWRVVTEGWRPLLLIHLTLLAAVLALLRGGGRIPTQTRTLLVASACAAVFFAGVLTYGRGAPGAPWFLACAITLYIVATPRSRLPWVLGALLALCVTVALLQTSGLLPVGFDPAQGLRSIAHWMILLVSLLLFVATIGWLVPDYRTALAELLRESHQQRLEIARRAEHDPLTGLPSVRQARRRIEAACARARRSGGSCAALFVDLDGFKAINDTFGHAAGDFCLVEVAARITARLRGEDTAARIGGDEFLVVLDTVAGPAGAGTLAEGLIEAIRQPLSWQGQSLQVGASIGVALFPADGTDAMDLVRAADTAMYAAKRGGRNQYRFSGARADGVPDASVSPRGGLAVAYAPDMASDRGSQDPLAAMRERIIDIATRVMCAMVGVSTLLSTVESMRLGVTGPVIGGWLLVGLLAVGHAARRHIPANARAALLCLSPLMIALPGLYLGGFLAAASSWSVCAALVMVAILGSRNAYLGAVGLAIALYVALAAAFVLDLRTAPAEFLSNADSPGRWMVYLLSSSAFAGVLGIIWTTLQDTARTLLVEIRAQSEQLRMLADHDPLTGLALQGPASTHLGLACRRGRRADGRVALLFIDLDGFKQVNDTLGHAAGDACLVEIARRLLTRLGEDDIAARIGGDEFMVVLEGMADTGEIRRSAQAMLQAICEPMRIAGQECTVGASIGVAVYPEDGATPDELRRNADAAMYAAKSAGKRVVVMCAQVGL